MKTESPNSGLNQDTHLATLLATLSRSLLPCVLAAARVQMQYFRQDAAVETKADNTPVTIADQQSETVILKGLADAAPSIPVIAEESAAAGNIPDIGSMFFLVDPLDGTREFIAGRPDFTINIALIKNKRPVFGLIYAPARDELYFTCTDTDAGPTVAYAATLPVTATDADAKSITVIPVAARKPLPSGLIVAVSQSNINAATEKYLNTIGQQRIIRVGSSMKFCLIAKGDADIYPRFGPTCEWDTAAGQAILEAAGGSIKDMDGAPFTYGHASRRFLNPHFIARGQQT